MATIYIPKKAFGHFSMKGDKVKTFKKPKDASQAARWRSSTKQTCVTRAKARGKSRP